jgi:hypothetical protein
VRGHVDEQALAAFREGLLPARKAARITAHLATCQRCAETDAQLAAVTTILARTPAPPMPASLAARLDAALAAEIARSATVSPSAAASPADTASPAAAFPDGAPAPGTVSPAGAAPSDGAASPAGAPVRGERAGRRGRTAAGRDPAARRPAPWRLAPRLAAAAAAVVILAGGGYAIARVLSPGHTGRSSSSAASPVISGPPASGRAPEAAPAAGRLPLVASGTHYRSGLLPAQVGAVLKRYPAPGISPGQPRARPTLPVTAFPNLAACVDHVAGSERPQLVDLAHYGTRPAAVIVVPAPGTGKLNVWVVGPGCSAQGGDVIATFSMPLPG